MAETTRQVTIRVSGRDDGTAGRAIDGIDSRLKSLKARFGESSMVGLFAKTAIGGGALLGVSVLSRAFAQSAAEAAKMAGELRRGEISAAQIPERLALAVPIFKDLYKGARELALAFTPIGRDITRMEQFAKDANAQMNAQQRTRGIVTESGSSLRGLMADQARERAMTTASPLGRDILAGSFKTQDKTADLRAAADKRIAELESVNKPVIDGLQKQLADLAGKLGAEAYDERKRVRAQLEQVSEQQIREIALLNRDAADGTLAVWKTAMTAFGQGLKERAAAIPSLVSQAKEGLQKVIATRVGMAEHAFKMRDLLQKIAFGGKWTDGEWKGDAQSSQLMPRLTGRANLELAGLTTGVAERAAMGSPQSLAKTERNTQRTADLLEKVLQRLDNPRPGTPILQ